MCIWGLRLVRGAVMSGLVSPSVNKWGGPELLGLGLGLGLGFKYISTILKGSEQAPNSAESPFYHCIGRHLYLFPNG